MRVVEAFDVGEAGHASFGLRGEGTPARQFAFQGREETFSHGVVVGVSDGAHRGSDAGFFVSTAESQRRVLAALVGVVDHIFRLTLSDSHIECAHDQLGPQMVLHGPSHDPAAEHVEQDGQVQEPAHCRHIGDVRHPEPVGRLGLEVAVHEVGGRPSILIAPRRRGAALAVTRPDEPGQAHQPVDALAAVALALGLQGGMDPRRPVGVARGHVHSHRNSGEHRIGRSLHAVKMR